MFQKYSSIENSYRSKQIDFIREGGFDRVEWVATEKLHGANFSFVNNDGQIGVASRSGLTDGSFYGCQEVVEGLQPSIQAMFKKYPEVTCVFGELFGHGIQKSITYGQKRFAAFDIVFNDSYVNYVFFLELCQEFNISTCTEIARGNFDDLLAIDPSFKTTMSTAQTFDIAEGFVMKPIVTQMFKNGERVILKKKSEGFSERAKSKKKKIETELTGRRLEFFSAAQQYVSDERVSSAISKYAENDFSLILSEVLVDIFNEMTKDSIDFDDVSTYNSIRKELSSLVAPIIRKAIFF